MKSEDIKSYWIRSNGDGTYFVDIETSTYTISYPMANVQFSCSQNIAFPIYINILDEDGNGENEYSLTLNN